MAAAVMLASQALVREAFHASGEKHFLLSRLLYSTLFGAEWVQAILGFAYLKCLDNLVDEDPDADRALGLLAQQRSFIERIYGGGCIDPALRAPERFGAPFFLHDRATGGRVRPAIEAILSTMEFDMRRRGQALEAAVLDAYVVELGTAVLRFLARFAAPGVELPQPYAELAARAYLYADTLIDMWEDLAVGLINVPQEDITGAGLSLMRDDPRLRRWMSARAAVVLDLFAAAGARGRTLERRTLRLLSTLYLRTKRRKLRRFLRREGLRALPQAAATSAVGGNT
jgi:hypothetical protein